MKNFELAITVNATKEDLWHVLFTQFGEVNNFNPLIDASHFTKGEKGEVGSERFCSIDSKNSVHERITRAEEGLNFDIEIFEGGLPMMDKANARFELIELSSNQTKVEVSMNYSMKPAFMGNLMKGLMKKMFFKLMIGLKYHLETGELVTKENIKGIERIYRGMTETDRFPTPVAMAS